MNKIKTVLFAFIGIVMVSCSNNTPEATAEAFFTCIDNKDPECAKKYCNEKLGSFISIFQKTIADRKQGLGVTDIKCETTETTATCSCKLGNSVKKVGLKKRAGKWLVTSLK